MLELDSDLGDDDPSPQLSVAWLFKSSNEGEVKTPFPLSNLEELAIGWELSNISISEAASPIILTYYLIVVKE